MNLTLHFVNTFVLHAFLLNNHVPAECIQSTPPSSPMHCVVTPDCPTWAEIPSRCFTSMRHILTFIQPSTSTLHHFILLLLSILWPLYLAMSTLAEYPCSLPIVPIPHETDGATVATDFAVHLDNLQEHHFVGDAVWRDIFALTGTLRTFYSASTISTAWQETTKRAKAGSFVLDRSSARIVRLPQGSSWIETRFAFETNAVPQTTCTGFVNLVPGSDGKWRIWVLRSILEQLKSAGDVDVLVPSVKTNGVTDGQQEQTHFECVIIGGGQAGLSTAGRMKALGISYVVLDKHQNIGDNWKTRYGSARCEFSLVNLFYTANSCSAYG